MSLYPSPQLYPGMTWPGRAVATRTRGRTSSTIEQIATRAALGIGPTESNPSPAELRPNTTEATLE